MNLIVFFIFTLAHCCVLWVQELRRRERWEVKNMFGHWWWGLGVQGGAGDLWYVHVSLDWDEVLYLYFVFCDSWWGFWEGFERFMIFICFGFGSSGRFHLFGHWRGFWEVQTICAFHWFRYWGWEEICCICIVFVFLWVEWIICIYNLFGHWWWCFLGRHKSFMVSIGSIGLPCDFVL